MSVRGAWRSACGQEELDELFAALGKSFSDCTSYSLELQAFDRYLDDTLEPGTGEALLLRSPTPQRAAEALGSQG